MVPARATRVLSLWGMSEADVATRIAPLVDTEPGIQVSYLPTTGRLELVISSRNADGAEARRAVARLTGRVRRRLGGVVFAAGPRGRTLEEVVGETLARRDLTLAVAESCTGGRIGALLTRVPGSSAYLDRVLVTYSNRSKEQALGVSRALLARHGAVSAEAAEAMARGVKRAARTDLGLATTGIAGPTGATPSKPVGLVFIALASGRRAAVKQFRFGGGRERIQARAAATALDILRLWLEIMEPAR
jgi:nicotinamide-nucleotide amidase